MDILRTWLFLYLLTYVIIRAVKRGFNALSKVHGNMKIRESKNLRCDKAPWRGPSEGYEKFDPEKCLLESFDRIDDKIIIFFKNGSQAIIKAINIEGGREVDMIENRSNDFLEKNYDEILDVSI